MTDHPRLDPTGTLAAFGRVAYSDLTSVVVLSLTFWVAALPVVTVGPAILALVAAQTAGVTGESAGKKVTERDRLRRFKTTFFEQFRPGLVLGLPLLAVAVSTGWYASLAVANRNGTLLVGTVIGLYATVLTLLGVFRAASIVDRTGVSGPRQALWDSGLLLVETPSFTVLHALFAATLLLLCLGLGVAVVILLPGLFGVLEVVTYEETSGDGALRVVRAYQGQLGIGEGG